MNNEDMVCYCSHVSRQQIIEALDNGAQNLEDIQKMTKAATLHKCYICHPKGICCINDILRIIDEYKKED